MAGKKKQNKSATTRWFRDGVTVEDLDPSERIAHTIVSERGDLLPSVGLIMSADLTPTQRVEALCLFQTSLDDLDDPNRAPRNAIEAARTTTD